MTYTIKCPRCGGKMEVAGEDVSKNFKVKPNKEYKRIVYVCKKDDVWITVEEPK